jgi:hypothetical protein
MAYNDPGPHRPDDYIDRRGDMGWTPIALGVAFLIVLGLLLFGAPKSADQPNTTAQRSELPKAAPSAPSVPVPPPPKPQ